MNVRKTIHQLLLLGTILLTVIAGVALLVRPISPVAAAAPRPLSYFRYLPLVLYSVPGIYGTVHNNGIPAVGIPVSLEYYDGTNTASIQATTTSATGAYTFLNVPTLASHQRYYVQYSPPAPISGTLKSWNTASLTSYQSGASAQMANFDIADVTLVSPGASVSVTLPATFTWNARPATPTDHYHFLLHGASITTFDSGDLGSAGSYNLTALPAGFTLGGTYSWNVKVEESDGSNGYSSETRKVTIQ